MRKITQDFFNNIIDEAILEYTKSRYISEEEVDDLKKNISSILDEKIVTEDFDQSSISVSFKNT